MLSRSPTHQVTQRGAESAPPRVPERQVNGGVRSHLGASTGRPDVRPQAAGVLVDTGRVLAEKVLGRGAVQIGLHGGGSEIRFAQAGQAVIGLDEQKDQVGDGFGPDGFDGRYFQSGWPLRLGSGSRDGWSRAKSEPL